jgi:stearoyl-CoA desaturase (delta-9 desaturase)
MRFWLWLTVAIVAKEWISVHRKHHLNADTQDDPHSPNIYGIKRGVFGSVPLYWEALGDSTLVENYGMGAPDDWVQNKIYTPYCHYGTFLLLAIYLAIFGWAGIIVWIAQALWVFVFNGCIQGVAHLWGYRNYVTGERSKNIFPVGILLSGEELHNNHHRNSASAKFSKLWYEFDLGWFYIRILEVLRLATVNPATNLSIPVDK